MQSLQSPHFVIIRRGDGGPAFPVGDGGPTTLVGDGGGLCAAPASAAAAATTRRLWLSSWAARRSATSVGMELVAGSTRGGGARGGEAGLSVGETGSAC